MTNNRAVSNSNLKEIEYQITRGYWERTGEQLIFSDEGKLLNGSHRCNAVVNTGISIWTDVVIGIKESAFDKMDGGRKRSPSDVLSALGYKNYTHLASCAVFALSMEAGSPKQAAQLHRNNSRKFKIFNRDVRNYVEANAPLFPNYVNKYVNVYKKGDKVVPFATLGGLMWFFIQKDLKSADDFFNKVAFGDNINTTHPVYVLRKIFIKDKITDKINLTKKAKMAYIIKAWNAFRLKKEVKVLKWSQKEEIPKII